MWRQLLQTRRCTPAETTCSCCHSSASPAGSDTLLLMHASPHAIKHLNGVTERRSTDICGSVIHTFVFTREGDHNLT